MHIMNRWLAAAGATAVVAATTVAQTNHVAWSKIETGPWTLTPIYAEENGTPGAVVSFLALADLSAIVGENLVAVWYQRDATGWTAKSWEAAGPWEAIKSVKQAMGIPDDEDERWGVAGAGAPTSAEEPKEYAAGVLAEDPLAAFIAGSPDRDVLVEFLTSIGYKAADIPVDKGAGACGASSLLSAYAAGIEADLVQCEAMDKAAAAMEAIRVALGGSCPDALAALETDPTFSVASVQHSTCDRPTTLPLPDWAPVRCTTDRGPYPTSTHYCWTYERTYTVTRTRVNGKFNSSPPPTYLFCTQTSTATRTDTQTCCSPWYPDPVPGTNPDCEDLVTPPPTPGSPGAPTCSPVRTSYPLQGDWSPNPCTPWVP